MAEKKETNLWNQILQQTTDSQKFQNKNVLVLGNKNTGKRTLFDQLHELSNTEFPKGGANDTNPGKLRIKGSSSAVDYVYLNVKNLEDADDDTMARVGFNIIDDEGQKDLLNIILSEKYLSNLMVVIMLDFTEPWKFMDQLNQWIDVFTKALENVDIPLKTLEDMKANVKRIVQTFKMPTDKKEQEQQQQEEEEQVQRDVPLVAGVLENNLGVPLLVVCNKSDTLEEIEMKQQEFIQYHLRQYCMKYGASLLFTSCKNNYNLDIFYEYILHIQYGFELKHKPEVVNHECVFIPAGFDNPDLLKQTFPGIDTEIYYTDKIKDTTKQKVQKSEIQVKDDNEFFQGLKEKYGGSNVSARPSITERAKQQRTSLIDSSSSKTTTDTQKKTEITNFYKGLLEKQNQHNSNKADRNIDLKQKAEQELQNKITGNTGGSSVKTDIAQSQKIQDLINKNKLTQQNKQQQQ